MSRVLRKPAATAGAVAPWDPGFNEAPTPEEAAAEAHRRGVEEGRSLATDQFISAAEALRSAVTEERTRLRAEFDRQRDVLLATAVRLAEFVLGHAGHDGGAALRTRIDTALQTIDDTHLSIAVHPADLELLERMNVPDITLSPDSTLRPGEARIVGEWSQTDLTYAAALAALQEAVADA